MGRHRTFQKYLYMFVGLRNEHEYLLWKMMTMKWKGKKNKEQGRLWNLVLCFFEWLVLSLLARILYRLSSVASRCVERRDWPSPSQFPAHSTVASAASSCVCPLAPEPEHTFQRGHTTASCVFSLNLVPVLCDLISTEGRHNV